MLHACLQGSIDGGAVVGFAAVPEGRVVVVHFYTGCGDEEEGCAACVGGSEGGGVIEVGLAEGDGLGAEGGEALGGRVAGGLRELLVMRIGNWG